MREVRITLVISGLGRGGAERVICMLANAWVQQGKKVFLLTLDGDVSPAYPVDARVTLRRLGLLAESNHFLQGLLRNSKRICVLRHAIRDSNPDIVISFMDTTNILTLLASLRLRMPVVVCEHIDPSHYHLGRMWSSLRRLMYPHADALVCLTKETLSRFQGINGLRGWVIPDVIAAPPAGLRIQTAAGDKASTQRFVIGMGRLVPQKGFDLLLKAFADVADRHPDWRLKVLGMGPMKTELEEQARALNLSAKVDFLGEVANPFPILCNADLFVFSSRFEGFGLALCEAMACGLPVISFDCPSGPGDIIRNGLDGVLVPAQDVAALAHAMSWLMGDATARERLGSRAPEVLVRFSQDKILSLWQRLFDELLQTPDGKGSMASVSAAEEGLGNDAR